MDDDDPNKHLDCVKFVLDKKFFVKRGPNVGLAALIRNVPGPITLDVDPENDIQPISWPDLTQG